MRDTFFLFWAGPRPLRRAELARFARLTQVGKSAGHQLASLYSRLADYSQLVG